MRLVPVLLVALVAVWLGSTSAGAHVRSLRSLTANEKFDLMLSEQRVRQDDILLEHLDRRLKCRQVSRRQYNFEARDLVGFIGNEAKFQNEIMVDPNFVPESVREVTETVGRDVVVGLEFIGCIAVRCLPALNVIGSR